MSAELAIGGLACLGLAAGHAAVGAAWVLPNLGTLQLPATRLGPGSLTRGMVRFTWHVVTVVLIAFGVLLLSLALMHGAPRVLLLRWVAGFWFAAAATACWNARRRPTSLLRFPVVFVMLLVAGLSWAASA